MPWQPLQLAMWFRSRCLSKDRQTDRRTHSDHNHNKHVVLIFYNKYLFTGGLSTLSTSSSSSCLLPFPCVSSWTASVLSSPFSVFSLQGQENVNFLTDNLWNLLYMVKFYDAELVKHISVNRYSNVQTGTVEISKQPFMVVLMVQESPRYTCHRVRKICCHTGARTRDPSLTGRVPYRLSYLAAWHISSLTVTKSKPSKHTSTHTSSSNLGRTTDIP